MNTLLNRLEEEERNTLSPKPLPLSIEKLGDLRRENELSMRELSSRQKVLTELGVEISENAAENPSSMASRSLVEQLQSAQKKFVPLVAVTKGRAENVTELSSAMVRIGDAKKQLGEKLTSFGDRL